MSPRVSVLMTVHNSAAFLDEAVRSVLAQTFTDFELVIVNDGSTDRSAAILERHAAADGRIRLLTLPARVGIPTASNRGIELCRAPWIARFDADDICLPERLELQTARIEREPRLVLLGGQIDIIDGLGATRAAPRLPLRHEEIDRALMGGNWPLMHPAILMDAAVLRDIGGYDPAYDRCSDHDLFLRLAERGKLENLPDKLIRYRIHFDAATAQARHGGGFKETAMRKACQRRGVTYPQADGGVTGLEVAHDLTLRNPVYILRALFSPGNIGPFLRFVAWRLRSRWMRMRGTGK